MLDDPPCARAAQLQPVETATGGRAAGGGT